VTGAPRGVTITLASSDASKVTISPSTVFIQQGATAPGHATAGDGVNFGSANINATAPGFVADTKPVQVAATISFAQSNLTMG